MGLTGMRRGLARAAAGAGAVCVLASAVAGAQPLAGGPAALRGVPGSGTFTFTGKGSFGTVRGTATTTVIPASITPGQPYRATMEVSWTETGQNPSCSPGTFPGQTTHGSFPLVTVRPGHGEDLVAPLSSADAAGDVTWHHGDTVFTCGATDTVRSSDGYEALVAGSLTKSYTPSCVAPGVNTSSVVVSDATFDGTFAVLSIGGADCTVAAVPPAVTTTTDTFTATGQAKPHAVAVPAKKTRAEITLRWAKPGDRFTVAGVVLVPKRKTASVGRTEKLKITFFSLTPTSVGVRISNLAPGKLTFRIVSKKLSGRVTVRTRVVLKA